MPKVSPTMTMGRLVAWKKSEGEFFEEGEDIADVESDKATMPISAREDGYIARILVQEDTPDLPLGTVLAVTVEEEEFIGSFRNYQPTVTASADDEEKEHKETKADTGKEQTIVEDNKTNPMGTYTGPVGPAVMRLMNEYPNIDLGRIKPSGKKGRILKGDVLEAIADGTAFADGSKDTQETTTKQEIGTKQVEQVDGESERAMYTDVNVTSMRRAIARRLVASKTQIPHRYASTKYELDALLKLRKQMKEEHGISVSVNDFMLKAIGVAMQRVPEMNVTWDESNGVIRNEGGVDVSIAVAIEGGLITPIVKGVDVKGLKEIGETSRELVKKAREGLLEPEEYEGGGFSLSNLGMFGIRKFSAIINPPQCGILAVGEGVKVPVGVNGEWVTEGVATLSADARAVDEVCAVKFLDEFSKCVSNPVGMLM